MRLLLISDSHGNVNRAFSAHTCSMPVDAVIHLGDGSADAEILRDALEIPVINVSGNCDPCSSAPRECIWECEGKKILLTHGDLYQVKSGLARLRQRAREIGVDAVFFGHTHLELCEEDSELFLINPGTLANHGSHRSYAVVTVTATGITSRHYAIE
jgi:uncharacterized protein